MLYLSPLFNGVKASQVSGTLLQDFSFKAFFGTFSYKGECNRLLVNVTIIKAVYGLTYNRAEKVKMCLELGLP